MGRVNERIARTQEVYVANATNGWLESLERSLVMMKEYQVFYSRVGYLQMLTSAGCTKEAGEPPIGLRRLSIQDAKGQKRRFQG